MTRKDIDQPVSQRKIATKRVKRIKDSVQLVICIYNGTLDIQLLFGS